MVIRAVGVVLLVAGVIAPALAQEGGPLGGIVQETDRSRARYQIAAMESVLERYVQLGARRLSQQVQTISPDMLFIGGAARARGFQLDGYGVFFNVEVPALRRSVAWSFRQMGRTDGGIEAAMASLKRNLGQVSNQAVRREMEADIQRLARLVGPVPPPPGALPSVGAQAVAASTQGPPPGQPGPTPGQPGAQPTPPGAEMSGLSPQLAAIIDDPGLAYTNEVKAALIDAMLDYGTPIPISDTEWLTIAARDDNSRLGGGDPYDVSTVMLRIRGSDLAAFRAGTLSRADAIARVEVREY
jgi:hypothetical protein